MHRRWFVLGVVTLGMSLLAVGKAADAGWQAGGARLNITPGQSMWMSGYGGRDHPSEGKLTDLWAKVLVLQDDTGTRLAIVTLDLVGLDRATEQSIRTQVAEQYEIPVSNTALFSSHTHTGPVVGTNLKAMYCTPFPTSSGNSWMSTPATSFATSWPRSAKRSMTWSRRRFRGATATPRSR